MIGFIRKSSKTTKHNSRKLSKRLKPRKAVWQFMKDHAHERKDGKLYIRFIVNDESNFCARVNAREIGYKRND